MQNEWFIKIFNIYIDDIYRLSYSYTHNRFDSDDITQRVFMKFFKNIDKINKDEKEVHKWLIVTTVNECKDLFKNIWNQRINPLGDRDIDIEDESQDDNEFKYYLLKLPIKYRLVFHLYYYYGYSTKEVAKILKMKETTIRQLLSRGRKILKLEKEKEND